MFLVDVESDGPAPGIYNMVCFGVVEYTTRKSFYGQTAPITSKYIPEALAISGFSRADHEKFPHHSDVMRNLRDWLKSFGNRSVFISDNPAFDFQWMSYYFALNDMENPFGFSGRRIGDFFAGANGNWRDATSWKKLRRTTHTHHPVDDAQGNAEALEAIGKKFNIKIA